MTLSFAWLKHSPELTERCKKPYRTNASTLYKYYRHLGDRKPVEEVTLSNSPREALWVFVAHSCLSEIFHFRSLAEDRFLDLPIRHHVQVQRPTYSNSHLSVTKLQQLTFTSLLPQQPCRLPPMDPPKEKRKKRRGALDWIPKPPRLPSLSPDIEVDPDGRALVDTRNGIDEVYFLSCNPYSTNRKLFGANFNNDEIEDYIDQFNRARSKFQPPIEPKQEGGGQDTEVKTINTSKNELIDHHNEDDDPRDIFESQAHTWHAVLKRRERAAFQQTTNPFTRLLTNIAPWHESLRITGTIRKIIRSLAGKHKTPRTENKH